MLGTLITNLSTGEAQFFFMNDLKFKLSQNKQAMLAGLLLAVVTWLLYAPALAFDFIPLDDPSYVQFNFHINHGFSWTAVKWSLVSFYSSNWHPLTWISHMLDCQFYGLKPGGHHATNILIHIFDSMLLFYLLLKLTRQLWPAFVVAALFAWHPLHVESVAWISERKDVLFAGFFLLTLLSYGRYVQGPKTARPPQNVSPLASGYYWLAFLCCALSLMSKPMAVTLPCVLLLLDYWPLQRRAPLRLLLSEKIPFLILAGVASFFTVKAQAQSGALLTLGRLSMAARAIHPPIAYLKYLKKLFWPENLSTFYPYESSWSFLDLTVPGLIIVFLTVWAFRERKLRPHWLFGWLWFLGTLVPVIGLLQAGMQAIADRFTYIPSIGLFIAVCWEVRDWVGVAPQRRLAAGFMAAAVLVACLALTSAQLKYWRNGGTLFTRSLAINPEDAITHVNYATYLRYQNDLAGARVECEAALRLAPKFAWCHYCLGEILFQENKLAPAEEQLRTALKLDGHIVAARLLLGEMLLERHLLAEATEQFAAALALDPGSPKAHYDLARLLLLQNKKGEAVENFRAAIRLLPDSSEALNDLAWLLAADSDPKNRNGSEAVTLASRACVLTRFSQPTMIGTLAAAFAEAGRFPEAIAAAEKARDTALAQGKKEVAERNAELLKLYRSNRAYHES